MEAAVGLIAGFALGIAADIVRQWLSRKTRREERSEAAAEELVALLDEAREPFLDAIATTPMSTVQKFVVGLQRFVRRHYSSPPKRQGKGWT